MMPGKKDTITCKKVKMQKWLLTDTLAHIHLKFLSENSNDKLSYSLFCRLRPFWVIPPTEQSRETCTCKVHDNLQFVIKKLHVLKLLPQCTIDSLCTAVSCSMTAKNCMYDICATCKDCRLPSECSHENGHEDEADCNNCRSSKPKLKQFDPNLVVQCHKWQSKVELHESKKSTITVKELLSMLLADLIDKFTEMLMHIRKHVFNIRHQYMQYRLLRTKLTDNDCLIRIDFTENYTCQYNRDIQSVHYGGSHKQCTMHTGVLYVGQRKPKSFCTLSDSRSHEPTAIWTYLEPVLIDLKTEFPNIETIHFFSDGPTTQYRQKKISSSLVQSCLNSSLPHGTFSKHHTARGQPMA